MIVFAICALAFAALLAYLAWSEYRAEKPASVKDWVEFGGVAAGILCTAVVAIGALF